MGKISEIRIIIDKDLLLNFEIKLVFFIKSYLKKIYFASISNHFVLSFIYSSRSFIENMKNIKYIGLLLLGFLLLVGCKKSQWKKPTEVTFMVDISKKEGMNGNLSFSDGQVVIRNITFDGKRTQADDVYFEADFDNGLKVLLSSSVVNDELVFDIPQGTYSTVRIDFEAERSDVELIRVVGKYMNSIGEEFPIVVEVEEIEFYDRVAKNAQGDVEIDLVAGNPVTAIIQLDPVFWLTTISSSQLDVAQTTIVDGEETILINPEINESLYDIIDDRVGMGAEIIFD